MNTQQDTLISQLQAQIYSKEQAERNLVLLHSKYETLKRELWLLSQHKRNLENELHKQNNNSNQTLSTMSTRNNTVASKLNESVSLNEELLHKNNMLYKMHHLQDQLYLLQSHTTWNFYAPVHHIHSYKSHDIFPDTS